MLLPFRYAYIFPVRHGAADKGDFSGFIKLNQNIFGKMSTREFKGWRHYIPCLQRAGTFVVQRPTESLPYVLRTKMSFLSRRGEAALHNRATDHTQSNITVDK